MIHVAINNDKFTYTITSAASPDHYRLTDSMICKKSFQETMPHYLDARLFLSHHWIPDKIEKQILDQCWSGVHALIQLHHQTLLSWGVRVYLKIPLAVNERWRTELLWRMDSSSTRSSSWAVVFSSLPDLIFFFVSVSLFISLSYYGYRSNWYLLQSSRPSFLLLSLSQSLIICC